MIDTEQLSEVARLDLPVADSLAVSLDGRTLALGTRVLDAATLEEIGHLHPDRDGYAVFGTREDVIYVESWLDNAGRVQAFSLPSLRLVGERRIDEDSHIDLFAGLAYVNLGARR